MVWVTHNRRVTHPKPRLLQQRTQKQSSHHVLSPSRLPSSPCVAAPSSPHAAATRSPRRGSPSSRRRASAPPSGPRAASRRSSTPALRCRLTADPPRQASHAWQCQSRPAHGLPRRRCPRATPPRCLLRKSRAPPTAPRRAGH